MVYYGHDVFESMAELEHKALEATGIHLSMLRFAISFVASVPVGLLFKFVPTVKGEQVDTIGRNFLLIFSHKFSCECFCESSVLELCVVLQLHSSCCYSVLALLNLAVCWTARGDIRRPNIKAFDS